MPTQTIKFSMNDVKEALKSKYPQLQTGKTLLWTVSHSPGDYRELSEVTLEVQFAVEPYGIAGSISR